MEPIIKYHKEISKEIKELIIVLSKFNELKSEYTKLVEEYEWTSLVYGSRYSFQPIVGGTYHLYKGDDLFLSLIEPQQWDKEYMGSFKLLTNGKWEKI